MEAPQQSPTKKSSMRFLKFGCGGMFALLVIMMLFYALLPKKTRERLEAERTEERHQERIQDSLEGIRKTDEENGDVGMKDDGAAKPGETTAMDQPVMDEHKGLGISRSKLTTLFAGAPFEFTFEQGIPVQGEENVVGTSTELNQNIIQLIGPPDDLTRASMTAVVGSGGDNTTALTLILGFAKQFDSEAVDWLGERWKGQSWKDDFEYQETFGQQRFEISYTRIGNIGSLSLTVSPS